MKSLRGESAHEVLGVVRAVESQSSIAAIAESSRNLALFPAYLRDGWIHVDHKPKRFKQVVVETVFDTVKLLLKLRFRQARANFIVRTSKPVMNTEVLATTIKVKNNILAIYPDFGLVAKMAKPVSIREVDSLHNEYLTLARIAAFEGLHAPEPLAFQREPIPTIWMKYVDHNRVSKEDTSKFSLLIAETLFEWYEFHGVTQISSSSYLPLANQLAAGIKSIIKMGWSECEATTIFSVLESIAESRTILLLSRIHGDASTGNSMVTSSGSLVINDWETSKLDIVGLDMLKLIRSNPEVEISYSRWRLKVAGSIGGDARQELALAGLLNGLDADRFLRYWTEVRALSSREVQKLIVAHKASVIEVCDLFRART